MTRPVRKARTQTITFRITDDLYSRLQQAVAAHPYKPSMTAVLERGLDLAICELAQSTKQIEGAS